MKKTSYNFEDFFRELMNNITNPVTLFVFPPFIILQLLSLSNLDKNITLTAEAYGKFTIWMATYTIYFSYALFGFVLVFILLRLNDSIDAARKLKSRFKRFLSILIILFLAIGFIGSSFWMVNVLEAHGKHIQANK